MPAEDMKTDRRNDACQQAAGGDIVIRRWSEIADKARLVPALDEIFFESSPTKTFADEDARTAFRQRWLGRYLESDPQAVYLAMDGEQVAGYLAGRFQDAEPTRAGEDIARFDDAAAIAADYPAHLHINLAPGYRNRGIGAQLIAAFAADVARAGLGGIHVVTGAASRNVRFYARNGFAELQRARFNGHEIILLGRRLAGQETA